MWTIIFRIIILNIDKIYSPCYTDSSPSVGESKGYRMFDYESSENAKSTRERVMQTLLTHQHCTINEIADAVEINPISVRHHITKLQADGLVSSAEERHGVGRPRRIYFLTENGREHFPSRYLRLTLRILEQLKETVPQPMVNQLFTQIAVDLAAEHTRELAGLSPEERLDLVKKVLTSEGFTVEWERQGEFFQISRIELPILPRWTKPSRSLLCRSNPDLNSSFCPC